jgi:hypothetical protein
VGLRFSRRVRLMPGLRVNLSKGGVSLSVGTRGAWYTVGTKGQRATVGLPGTGLSWTEYAPHSKQSGAQLPPPMPPASPGTRRRNAFAIVCVIVVVLWGLYALAH